MGLLDLCTEAEGLTCIVLADCGLIYGWLSGLYSRVHVGILYDVMAFSLTFCRSGSGGCIIDDVFVHCDTHHFSRRCVCPL